MTDPDVEKFPPEPATDPGHVLSEADWAAVEALQQEIAANMDGG